MSFFGDVNTALAPTLATAIAWQSPALPRRHAIGEPRRGHDHACTHTPPRPHDHGLAPPSRPHHCELSRPLPCQGPHSPCLHRTRLRLASASRRWRTSSWPCTRIDNNIASRRWFGLAGVAPRLQRQEAQLDGLLTENTSPAPARGLPSVFLHVGRPAALSPIRPRARHQAHCASEPAQ